ncbi:hypothetical protein BOTBODRAFT_633199 [Botryobasidium botryosum FD-172 SS1]|uniref:Uncharacterized protein n=1 Tax=Botryobasidium botryosum (strain FD-172 SS1) TaxID=930990 RepID=A0A067MBX4_BOTB1|nr:hypothetical protein BOTBODRAFT_633199 [Botryobasidium botryosum FD-172 SS1]
MQASSLQERGKGVLGWVVTAIASLLTRDEGYSTPKKVVRSPTGAHDRPKTTRSTFFQDWLSGEELPDDDEKEDDSKAEFKWHYPDLSSWRATDEERVNSPLPRFPSPYSLRLPEIGFKSLFEEICGDITDEDTREDFKRRTAMLAAR